jgi:hypothetical protein
VDPTIRPGSATEIMRCIHIGLLCVQENVADRPIMASIVLMLNSYSISLPIPLQPAFLCTATLTRRRHPAGGKTYGVLQSQITNLKTTLSPQMRLQLQNSTLASVLKNLQLRLRYFLKCWSMILYHCTMSRDSRPSIQITAQYDLTMLEKIIYILVISITCE